MSNNDCDYVLNEDILQNVFTSENHFHWKDTNVSMIKITY
jgi:hypothetical protein